MRAEPIDSTKRLLRGPEIIFEYLQKHDTDTEHSPQAKMAAISAEITMDDADVIQFGNTAFISHYGDDNVVFMRALNVDTARNFIDNTENYVAYAFGRGVKCIATQFSDPVIATLIKRVKQNLEKHNPNLDVGLEFTESEGEHMALVTLKG